jgi:hypothetical protein
MGLKPSRLITADLLVALVSSDVSSRGSHPSPPRQGKASRHPPTTGVSLTEVVERAPVKRHGCPRGS